jgi:hypothetical protein
MRSTYLIARFRDLEEGDWLEVRCACGHVGRLHQPDLAQIHYMTLIRSLEPRFRCKRCRRRGDVVVTVINR